MREQNCRNARQPANEHRRVLGGRIFYLIQAFILKFSFSVNSSSVS